MLFPGPLDLVVGPKVEDSELNLLILVQVQPSRDQDFLVHRAEFKLFGLLTNVPRGRVLEDGKVLDDR